MKEIRHLAAFSLIKITYSSLKTKRIISLNQQSHLILSYYGSSILFKIYFRQNSRLRLLTLFSEKLFGIINEFTTKPLNNFELGCEHTLYKTSYFCWLDRFFSTVEKKQRMHYFTLSKSLFFQGWLSMQINRRLVCKNGFNFLT